MKNRKYDSVVFDVDSTLVTFEGLDFLAKLKGKEKELSKITKSAMNGDMSMRESMERKMRAISPDFEDIVKMGNEYIKNITPGALETIKILKTNGIQTWILTGNFQPAVGMLANFLGIKSTNVITNNIFFDENKKYLSFDRENPLSNNGGKAIKINEFKNKMGKTVLIGDGSTDLEAKESVNLFIGFGGVIFRPKIKAASKIYITEPNLMTIIPYILDNYQSEDISLY
ncbi:MAG: hypothetical protein UU16_C0003G0004 [Candidatus Woesebacteria bacterium GW2011_GWA2_40_7]|uniref:phosphoserine phosphatase n=3 Tax=Candidatus Woeseibacteriota TaxID=1752722 RepID=A0A0G0UVC6_9BACT|nr:MAG: hypothetical protein UT17_C0002G0031 [Candidatus Woesebacteria bacterium GW2011_GWB1_39_10]KKR74243.1 MAG: hypothetical protein UU16_C0003G0004 [Candidatus Woesebacteria bacterium GW2011_GWA2_40_7]KKR92618.1 MAG: hypothetical protein UU42_C0001G0222 [Candidatus Woesebacteria bacterium GW2011_GWA1_41_13b]